MFIPHPPRVKIPHSDAKYGFQRPPAGGILRDNVTAFEKPATQGDKQNQMAFKPPVGG